MCFSLFLPRYNLVQSSLYLDTILVIYSQHWLFLNYTLYVRCGANVCLFFILDVLKALALLVLIFPTSNSCKFRTLPKPDRKKRLKVQRPDDLTFIIETVPVCLLIEYFN